MSAPIGHSHQWCFNVAIVVHDDRICQCTFKLSMEYTLVLFAYRKSTGMAGIHPATCACPGDKGAGRRVFLYCGAAAFALAAGCSTISRRELPVPLELFIAASERLNPTEQGRPSPVLVRIYGLNQRGFFTSADYFALLGSGGLPGNGEVVDVEEFMLMPGEVRVIRRRAALDVRFIGVAAGYRDVGESVWRAIAAVPAPHRAGRLWARDSSPVRKYSLMIGERAVVIEESEE